MKIVLKSLFILSFLLVISVMSVFAEEQIKITYQKFDVTSDGAFLSGSLTVNIQNISGQDIQNVVLWIPGVNIVTYDNHEILAGDLANGESKDIIKYFRIPEETTPQGLSDISAVWSIEFSTGTGDRVVKEVSGTIIP